MAPTSIVAEPADDPEPGTGPEPTTTDELRPVDTTTLGFLVELGEALLDAGDAGDAGDAVHSALEEVARVNGKDGLGAVVLPTAEILSVPGSGAETTEVAVAGRSRLRLDQIESLMSVVQRAERGELTPDDGLTELRAIRAQRLTDIVAFPALVAPLITFLPGALLTIAVLELATGQILAGSSRLASGFFQLVLLRSASSGRKGSAGCRSRRSSSCCTWHTQGRCWVASSSAARAPRSSVRWR